MVWGKIIDSNWGNTKMRILSTLKYLTGTQEQLKYKETQVIQKILNHILMESQ